MTKRLVKSRRQGDDEATRLFKAKIVASGNTCHLILSTIGGLLEPMDVNDIEIVPITKGQS